jgi:hypothetical protein
MHISYTQLHWISGSKVSSPASVPEIPVSNLGQGTGSPDCFFVSFSSVPTGKFYESALNLATTVAFNILSRFSHFH